MRLKTISLDISGLRGTRKVILRHLTNSSRKAQEIIDSDSEHSQKTLMKVSSLKTRINDKLSKVKELDQKILNGLEQEDSERELYEILTRENEIVDVLTKIDFFLEKPAVNNPVNSSFTSSRSSEARVKLPKLEIPKFNGNIINWRGFWDQYKSAIHDNENISEVEKFTYLKSFLADSALATISGLNLNAENYKEAIDILEKRYSNVQVLISAFMTKFVQLPRIRSSNDVSNLRKIYDEVEFSVRNLKLLKVETSSYGSLLVPLLNKKLPNNICFNLARKFKDDVWNLDDMLIFLKTEIEAKER